MFLCDHFQIIQSILHGGSGSSSSSSIHVPIDYECFKQVTMSEQVGDIAVCPSAGLPGLKKLKIAGPSRKIISSFKNRPPTL